MADEIDPLARKLTPLLRRFEEMLAAQHDLLREITVLVAGENPLGAAVNYWNAAWSKKYGSVYLWNHAKDKGALKRLLKTMPVEDLMARMAVYLSSDEPFHTRNTHPIAIFISSINSWGTRQPDRFPGCRHDPPCKSDVMHTRKRLYEDKV